MLTRNNLVVVSNVLEKDNLRQTYNMVISFSQKPYNTSFESLSNS